MRIINTEPSRAKLGFRFNLVILMFVFWTLAQLIIPIKFLPYLILSKIEIFKMLVPAVGIMLCTLLYADKLKISRVSIPFILFCGFVLAKYMIVFLTLNRPLDYFSIPIMYICWVAIMFVTTPAIFSSLQRVRVFLRCMLLTFSLVGFFSILFVVILNIDMSALYSHSRFAFVYGNPLYFGGVCYSIVCCSLMLIELSDSRVEKTLLCLLSIFCTVAILVAVTRTFMVGILVLYLVYWFCKETRPKSHLVFVPLVCTIIVLLLLLNLAVGGSYFSSDEVNSLSSGRLTNWWSSIAQAMNGFDALWGGSGLSNYDKVLVVDDNEAVNASFQRYSIDSTYIEVFINSGIFGLGLFFWGLVNVLRAASFGRLRDSEDSKELLGILSAAYAVVVSLVVCSLFYGSYPSLGNTINSAALPAALVIIFLVNRETISIKRETIK